MGRFLGLGNGKDGIVDLSSYTQTWYSCSGTSGSNDISVTGTFNPGDRVYIHQTTGGANAGKSEDNTVASYVAGTLTLVHKLERDYTDSGDEQAQITVVKQASSVTGSLTVPAWDGNVDGGFVIACNGIFDGIINGDGKGFRGGVGTAVRTSAGEGSVGPGVLDQTTANGHGGGGGTPNASGPGGGGGATGGTDGTVGEAGFVSGAPSGDIGDTVGDETLDIIFPGGGGGSGGSVNIPAGWVPGGDGGRGGAFCVIYTDTASASSSVSLNAGNGLQGVDAGSGSGAGGSGGSLLLKCRKNLGLNFSATGGTGAPRNNEDNGDYGGKGGGGGKGRFRVESCINTSGTEDPTASLQVGGHTWCSSGIISFL